MLFSMLSLTLKLIRFIFCCKFWGEGKKIDFNQYNYFNDCLNKKIAYNNVHLQSPLSRFVKQEYESPSQWCVKTEPSIHHHTNVIRNVTSMQGLFTFLHHIFIIHIIIQNGNNVFYNNNKNNNNVK